MQIENDNDFLKEWLLSWPETGKGEEYEHVSKENPMTFIWDSNWEFRNPTISIDMVLYQRASTLKLMVLFEKIYHHLSLSSLLFTKAELITCFARDVFLYIHYTSYTSVHDIYLVHQFFFQRRKKYFWIICSLKKNFVLQGFIYSLS